MELWLPDVVVGKSGIWVDSRAYSSLVDAVNAIGSAKKTIYISKVEEVDTDLTIGPNVSLCFIKEGAINQLSGTTTFNTKNIAALNSPIFTGNGHFSFAAGTVLKTSWFESLNRALSETSNCAVVLEVDEASSLAANATCGEYVVLRFTSQGTIVALEGYDLTINGKLEAGRFQIFDQTGGGEAKLTSGAVDEVYPEWWGAVGDGVQDDTAAFQAAVNAAKESMATVSLAIARYKLTSTVTFPGAVNVKGLSHLGSDETASTILYLGSAGPVFLFTEKADYIVWSNFRISCTGNAATDIDVVDIDKGGSGGHFSDIDIYGNNMTFRHGFVLRGVSQFNPGVANDGQWYNVWENCRVTRTVGICFYLYGQDIADARCNANTIINCTTGNAAETAIYINGSHNAIINCNLNRPAGNYGMVVYGNQSRGNVVLCTLFDGWATDPAKKIKITTEASSAVPLALFSPSHNINNAADFEQYNMNGTPRSRPPQVNIFGSGASYIDTGFFGNGTPELYGFNKLVTRISNSGTIELGLTDCGKVYETGSVDVTYRLPNTEDLTSGWHITITSTDASYLPRIVPYTGARINSLAVDQAIKLGGGRSSVTLLYGGQSGHWNIVEHTGDIIVPVTSSITIGQRGALSPGFVVTNEGATGTVVVTVPAPVGGGGETMKFCRVANQVFRIAPVSGSNYRGMTSGKYKELGSLGAILAIRSVTANVWDVEYSAGTITNEP